MQNKIHRITIIDYRFPKSCQPKKLTSNISITTTTSSLKIGGGKRKLVYTKSLKLCYQREQQMFHTHCCMVLSKGRHF